MRVMPNVPAKPTVLLVITRGEPGGAQVHVLDLVSGLKEVVNFEVALGDNEFLTQRLRELGISVSVVPGLQRSISATSDLRAMQALRRLAARVNPAFLHTHSTKAGLLGRIVARSLGIPSLHTAHAWSFSDGLPRRRRAFAIPIEALAGRITDRFIVVSAADKEVALRCHVATDSQVTIVHNGVRDVPERAKPGAAAVPVISMVARMAAPKDHLLLLRALAGIPAPYRLRLIGDGPDRPALEAEIQRLGIGAQVEFTGVSHEVPQLLASSHIGALLSKQEGFPLAVLEAMRAGLPMVASDVGGVREAVAHQKTGFLIGRGEEASLRDALLRLLTDSALREQMGEAGRKRYLQQFSVEKMLRETLSVYRAFADFQDLPRFPEALQ